MQHMGIIAHMCYKRSQRQEKFTCIVVVVKEDKEKLKLNTLRLLPLQSVRIYYLYLCQCVKACVCVCVLSVSVRRGVCKTKREGGENGRGKFVQRQISGIRVATQIYVRRCLRLPSSHTHNTHGSTEGA